ncbi:helix-turn-helix domain-containing protein [Novosphingobium sp.]|uniref:helix-turn-helix domain-containing protein n=1 Tax=Novosphingobium sp. TaxID=1874826 RepID=UPI00262A1377|nr:helix-turn-helix domain-containing protein [Novosphingobium sp.]
MIIRKLRLERGLTQEQLATMAGVSIRTLQRIERGAPASAETLKCLAAVLDLDFADLRKETAMPEPTQSAAASLPELTEAEREALEYVRDIKGFYIHAANYAVVVLASFAANIWSAPHTWWAVWVALGWGLGLAYHGLSVFEVFHPFSDRWELEQMRKRLERTRVARD